MLTRPLQPPLLPPLSSPLRGSSGLPWEGGGGGSAWSPLRLTALRGWYRADLGVTISSGTDVDAWADQSGSGNHLTAAAATNRVTYEASGIGGKPSILSPGTDEWLRDTTFDWGGVISAYMIHFVFQEVAFTAGDIVWRYTDADGPFFQQSGGNVYRTLGQGLAVSTVIPQQLGTACVVTAAWDGSTQYLYRNGSLVDSDPLATAMPADDSPFHLFASAAGAMATNCRSAEIVVQRAYSVADITAFDVYASGRYGV